MITDREIALEKEVTTLKRLMLAMSRMTLAQQDREIDAREKAVDAEIEARTDDAKDEEAFRFYAAKADNRLAHRADNVAMRNELDAMPIADAVGTDACQVVVNPPLWTEEELRARHQRIYPGGGLMPSNPVAQMERALSKAACLGCETSYVSRPCPQCPRLFTPTAQSEIGKLERDRLNPGISYRSGAAPAVQLGDQSECACTEEVTCQTCLNKAMQRGDIPCPCKVKCQPCVDRDQQAGLTD